MNSLNSCNCAPNPVIETSSIRHLLSLVLDYWLRSKILTRILTLKNILWHWRLDSVYSIGICSSFPSHVFFSVLHRWWPELFFGHLVAILGGSLTGLFVVCSSSSSADVIYWEENKKEIRKSTLAFDFAFRIVSANIFFYLSSLPD